MKTKYSLVVGLLLFSAVAIFGMVGAVGAQSSSDADLIRETGRAGGGGDAGASADSATPGSITTLDQIRRLPREMSGVEITVAKSTPVNPRQGALKEVNALLAKLKSNEDRANVEAQLRQALAEYFLADMRHRVRELDAIKAKVAETEAGLQKRLDAQQESIDLQMKLFLHEADGLGFFPSEDTPNPASDTLGGTPGESSAFAPASSAKSSR